MSGSLTFRFSCLVPRFISMKSSCNHLHLSGWISFDSNAIPDSVSSKIRVSKLSPFIFAFCCPPLDQGSRFCCSTTTTQTLCRTFSCNSGNSSGRGPFFICAPDMVTAFTPNTRFAVAVHENISSCTLLIIDEPGFNLGGSKNQC